MRRRLELRGTVRGVSVYDDFAHHPTAILETLRAVRLVVSGSADLGRLRAAIGDVVPACVSGRLRAGVRGVRRRRDRARVGLPIVAARRRAAVGRRARRRPRRVPAGTRVIFRTSTTSCATIAARSARRRPRRRSCRTADSTAFTTSCCGARRLRADVPMATRRASSRRDCDDRAAVRHRIDRGRAAGAAHDVRRGRSGGLAGRRAIGGRAGRRSSGSRAITACARHGARRRIERRHRRRRHSRRRRSAAADRASRSRRRTACAPRPASRSTDWCDGRSGAAWPGSRPGRARPAPSAARSTATRTTAARTSATSCARSWSSTRSGETGDRAGATRWSSATTRAGCSETREILVWAEFAVAPGDADALRARRARIARVPQAHAAARDAERGVRVPESGSVARSDCRRACPRRPARSSIAPVSKGTPVGGARISPTHANFIVNDGSATARRHPRAHRARARGRARAVRRRAAGRGRVAGRTF